MAYRIQPYQKYTPTPDLFLTRVLNEEEYSVAGFTGLVIRKTLGHVNRANPKERKWIAPIARSQFKTEMGVAPCSFRVGRRRAVAQGYVIEEQPADEAKMRGAEYSIGIPLVVRGIRDRLRQLHVR